MRNRMRNDWVLWACRIAVVAAFAVLVAYAFVGCAMLQKVVRGVDQIAEDACVLFGTQNPDEIRALVIQVRPELADKARGAPNPNVVRSLCAIREIVSPFLQQQQMMQSSTKASLQRPPGDGPGSGSEQARDGGIDAGSP